MDLRVVSHFTALALSLNLALGANPEGGSVQGIVYNDRDGNGAREEGEMGIARTTLFLDLNDNGVLDEAEPRTVSAEEDSNSGMEAGVFQFNELEAGSYSLRTLVPAGTIDPRSTSSVPASEIRLRLVDQISNGSFDPNGEEIRGIKSVASSALSPDGRHFYVGSEEQGEQGIALFGIHLAYGFLEFAERFRTEALLPDGMADADLNYQVMAMSADGRSLFTGMSHNGGGIARFERDAISGHLEFVEMLTAEEQYPTGVFVIPLTSIGVIRVSADDSSLFVSVDANRIVVFDESGEDGGYEYAGSIKQGEPDFDGTEVDGLDGINDFQISPDGRHVYVVAGDGFSSSIGVFRRDPDNKGRLLFEQAIHDIDTDANGNTFEAILRPEVVEISPEGKHVYVASSRGDALLCFRRDAERGRLSLASVIEERKTDGAGNVVEPLSDPIEMVHSRDGRQLLLLNRDTLHVFARDLEIGELILHETLEDQAQDSFGNPLDFGLPVQSAHVSPDGRSVYIASDSFNPLIQFYREPLNAATDSTPIEITDAGGEQEVYVGLIQLPGLVHGNVFEDSNGDGSWIRPRESELESIVVFADLNRNQTRDEDEPFSRSALNGEYLLKRLPPGELPIGLDPPPDFSATASDDGFFQVDMSPGRIFAYVNLGLQPDFGDLHGGVFVDSNTNGLYDAGESPKEMVLVYMDLDENALPDEGEPSVATGSDGLFTFERVFPGTYFVRSIVPDGYRLTAPEDARYRVDVGPGDEIRPLGFGIAPDQPSSIEGRLYHDSNRNGRFDENETGAAMLTVYLDHNRNSIREPDEPVQTISDTGRFHFDGLSAGDYVIRLDPASESDDSFRFFGDDSGFGRLEHLQSVNDSSLLPNGAKVSRILSELGSNDPPEITRDGAFLYTRAPLGVGIFRRDKLTGRLTFIEVLEEGTRDAGGEIMDGLNSCQFIRLSPDDRHLHVYSDQSLHVFERDSVTGRLRRIQIVRAQENNPQDDFALALTLLTGLEFDKNGRFLYTVGLSSNNIGRFARDIETGELRFQSSLRNVGQLIDATPNIQSLLRSMWTSPDRSHLYIGTSFDQLIVLDSDPESGELAAAGVVNDILYEEEGNNATLFPGVFGLEFSDDGAWVYVFSRFTNSLIVYRRDPSSGLLTLRRRYGEERVDFDGLSVPDIGFERVALTSDNRYLFGVDGLAGLGVFSIEDGFKLRLARFIEDSGFGNPPEFYEGLTFASSILLSPDDRQLYVFGGHETIIAFQRDLGIPDGDSRIIRLAAGESKTELELGVVRFDEFRLSNAEFTQENGFQFHIENDSLRELVVERSEDLRNWVEAARHEPVSMESRFNDPTAMDRKRLFYRVRWAQP